LERIRSGSRGRFAFRESGKSAHYLPPPTRVACKIFPARPPACTTMFYCARRFDGGATRRAGARAARNRCAVACQGEADRHRLRVHEVILHRLGDNADPPISRARWLCRLAAELHERRDHRRRRRLGKTLGCIASSITVNLPEPGLFHRGAAKHGTAHTVFRAGARPRHSNARRKYAVSSSMPTAPR